MANIPGFRTARKCICSFPQFLIGDCTGVITKVFKTEFLSMDDGTIRTRRHDCSLNSDQWKEVDTVVRPQTPPEEKTLWVIRQRQVDQHPHWSLFAAVNDGSDSPKGRVWQVCGDADVGMHYAHRSPEQGISIFLSSSFLDSILLENRLSLELEARVHEIATTVDPPHRAIKGECYKQGTCRTWVWEVVDRLAHEGIVAMAAAEEVRSLHTLGETE